jgi:hypothetical protein
MRNIIRTSSILLALACGCFAAADTLYLRGAEQAPGQTQEITREKVLFKTRDGVKEYPKEDVLKVQLQQPRKYDEVESKDAITDADLLECLKALPTPKDYPSDGAVVLFSRKTFDLTSKDRYKVIVRNIILVLQQRGEDAATNNVLFFDDTDSAAVDFALTITPDGRVLHLDDSALKVESVHARYPEYRRLSRLRFACKEPRPGSILDVQYTITRGANGPFDTLFSEDVYGGEYPVLRKDTRILPPAKAKLAPVSTVRVPEALNAEVAAWSLKAPMAGITPEPNMPPNIYFLPAVVLGAPATWPALAKTYRESCESLPGLPEDAVAKAKELFAQGGPAAIHDFVARTIRLVPVPQLHFRLTPGAPTDTLARGAANELDLNYLYFAMLKAADVPCEFALLRSRGAGPFTPDVPSMRAFDASAVLIKEGDGRFTTATSEILPFEALPSGYYGANALVLEPVGRLCVIPHAAPDIEASRTEFTATLADDGNLNMTIMFSGNGNAAAWMRGLKNLGQQDLGNRLQQFVASWRPAGTLTNFKHSDLADLRTPPSLTLDVTIPNFATRAGDLMLMNIPSLNYDAAEVGRPTREHAMWWDYILHESCTGRINLPKGYGIYTLPTLESSDTPVASYKADMRQDGDALLFEDAFALKSTQAPAEQYGQYKTCIETRADATRQRIILKRM